MLARGAEVSVETPLIEKIARVNATAKQSIWILLQVSGQKLSRIEIDMAGLSTTIRCTNISGQLVGSN